MSGELAREVKEDLGNLIVNLEAVYRRAENKMTDFMNKDDSCDNAGILWEEASWLGQLGLTIRTLRGLAREAK